MQPPPSSEPTSPLHPLVVRRLPRFTPSHVFWAQHAVTKYTCVSLSLRAMHDHINNRLPTCDVCGNIATFGTICGTKGSRYKHATKCEQHAPPGMQSLTWNRTKVFGVCMSKERSKTLILESDDGSSFFASMAMLNSMSNVKIADDADFGDFSANVCKASGDGQNFVDVRVSYAADEWDYRTMGQNTKLSRQMGPWVLRRKFAKECDFNVCNFIGPR